MKIWQVLIALQLSAIFWSSLSMAGSSEPPEQVVAITSSSYNPGEISRNTLRAIFVMRHAKWYDGTPVKVYVYADDAAEHAAFSKEVLKFFPRQLRQAWDKQVFSGLGQYPEQVSSTKEMLAKVKATPGSVGYVSIHEVNKDVRILQIEP